MDVPSFAAALVGLPAGDRGLIRALALKAVTTAQANEAARQYTKGDDFLVVLAGDRATVAPTLADLGIPIVMCDPQGNRIP